MRAVYCACLVLMVGAVLRADGEYIYTFHTPGKIHVYLHHPENPRTVTFELRTFPEDVFVLAGSTRSDSPYRNYVTEDIYRLEANEPLTVMVGEDSDEECPNLFVQPRPGGGWGSYLYTGDSICTNIGRAFLYSPEAGARFNFAGADLLDPVTVTLPATDRWMEVTDRVFHNVTYLRTNAVSGTLQFFRAAGSSGYFVPPSADGYYVFYAAGIDLPSIDLPVRLHVVAGEEETAVVFSRWIDGRNAFQVWSGSIAPGEEYTRDIVEGNFYQVRSDFPVVVMVMPASEAIATDFMQFAYPLDQEGYVDGPSCGTQFKVPLRDGGRLRLFGGSGTTEVEIYDAANEYVDRISFSDVALLKQSDIPAGWYLLRSRGERFAVQVETEEGGNTYVPRNIVADVIDRPLTVHNLRHSPLEPTPTDHDVYLSCITNQPTTTVFQYRHIGDASPITIDGSTTPSTSHWALVPMTSLIPGDRYQYTVLAEDPVTGESVMPNEEYFIVEEGAPDIVYVSSSLTQEDDQWILETTLRNDGTDAAFTVGWTYSLQGMIPVDDILDNSWDSMEVSDDDRFIYHAVHYDPVPMGGSLTLRTTLRPYLHRHYWLRGVVVGDIDYRDRRGNPLTESVARNLYANAGDLADVFAATDYVILTCPTKLYDVFPDASRVANLLMYAAVHARTRNGGVLAMASSTQDANSIRGWIGSRFGSAVSEDWLANGYMVILGETGVIPAFYWRASSHRWEDSGTLWRARNFDQYWADTRGDDYARPELCLGRIIGNTPGEMQLTLQNALTPTSRYLGIIMSGTGNGAKDYIQPSATRFWVSLQWEMNYLHSENQLSGTSDDDLRIWFRDKVGGADIIGGFFHGNYEHMGPIGTETVLSTTDPVDFEGKHPLVFTPACLTGRYWLDQMSLAEAFLIKGAAVYIGATTETPLSTSRNFTGSVGDYLTDRDTTYGRAFRNGKRHWANTNDAWKEATKYTAFVMNYYGDPARPTLSDDTNADGGGANDEPAARTLDKGSLTITIPKPTVEDHGTYDSVSLGGGTLEEQDRPVVPIYTEVIQLPAGERVIDVKLDSRAQRTEGDGLRLPLPTFYYGEAVPPEPVLSKYPDFWPAAELPEFEWKVSALRTEKGEIVDELILSIRPFNYHSRTREWYLYQRYVFDVETVTSSVTITEIVASPSPSSLSDSKLEVQTTGVNQSISNIDGRWTMRLRNEQGILAASGSGACVIPSGKFSLDLSLPVFAGANPDRYKLDVALFAVRGAETRLLHRDSIDHVHGLSEMVIEEVAVRPGEICVDTHPTVQLSAQIRNRGETNESGEVHAEVWQIETGERVAAFSQEFEKVDPGGRIDFDADWMPGAMLEGTYRTVFRVECEGGSAPVKVSEFSGCRSMELSVVPDADSYTQCQTAVIFARARSGGEDVEGVHYSARITTPLGSASFTTVEEHPLGWAYLLYQFAPRHGEGIYQVRVTASADGYRTATATRSVVLSRNPAVLWPQRMHETADGLAVMVIDLGPVFTTHGWNPLINKFWNGRAQHGFDPIFGDPWKDDPPPGWDNAIDRDIPLTLEADGALVTLSTTAGEILNPDVNGKIPGIQVRLTDGRAQVLLQAPEEAALAYVLAATTDAESLGFTRVNFTTADPNENGSRWCVGDLRKCALARNSISPGGEYEESFDLDADGSVATSDVMTAVDRWRGPDAGDVHPPEASNPSGAVTVTLRGDWDTAAVGETLEIRIDVRSGEPLSGLGVVLDHDPSVLDPNDIRVADWFSERSGILMPAPRVEAGRLRMGALRRDREDLGITGEGTVFIIEAEVLANGPMGLALRGAIAAGPDGRDLPVILVSEDHEAGGEPSGLRGDANDDGTRDISDAIYVLSCLFLGGPCPTSDCAADTNHDGSRDISDAVFLLGYLFLGGKEPDACP